MNRSIVFLAIIFVAFIASGIMLSKSNSFRNTSKVSQMTDSLNQLDSSVGIIDTSIFVMPEYNEQAIAEWQQQMAIAQMSPEQRAEYQRQYQMYMQQMQQQEHMMKLQKEYEQKMRENGGVPPVSEKTQSRIEKLKLQFEAKRIKDSIANAGKGVQIN